MRNLRISLSAALMLLFILAGISIITRRASADDGPGSTFEFIGQVVSLPSSGLVGDWTVNRRIVHVSTSTIIEQEDGPIVVGSVVEVKGTLRQDGSIDATKIESEEAPSPSPSPRPSPSPGCHEFAGHIQALPNTQGFIGDWTVDNLIVHVTSSTSIKTEDGATIALGAPIEIEGCMRQDGSIDATKIEVERVSSDSGAPCFNFFGTIETLPNTQGFIGDWTVAHRTVHVTSSTILKMEQGNIAVGSFVEVKGCLQPDGTLNATTIEVERASTDRPASFFEFFGAVQTLPAQGLTGDWVINGRTVHVTSDTRIVQGFRPLVVGSFVRVIGTLQPDNTVTATRIQVERSRDTGHRLNYFELFGAVKALPTGSSLIGDWTVNNLTVHVGQNTQIVQQGNQAIAVGSRVVVVGTQRTDLSLDAVKIRVLNSVDPAENFVREHYNDFLNREPEASGLGYWTNEIQKCGDDQNCIRQRRIDVSAAFFHSKEFQETGYFVYRYYQASFGRMPTFSEFLADVQRIAQNIDSGDDVLEANKLAFGNDWVTHPAFTAIYDSKTNAQYVDLLFANAGVTPDESLRQSLINGLNSGTETRASVLRKIVDNPVFFRQDFNRAFVLMQYFGYLRRDPEKGGFDFWYNVLNNKEQNNFRGMVCSFITSAEYQLRFSNAATHSNRECGQ